MVDHDESGMSRRSFARKASGMATVSGLSALAIPSLASEQSLSRAALNFQNPEDNLYGLLKLMGDLSGQPIFWTQPGRIYAFQDGELAFPILDYTGCTIRSIKQISSGEYQSRYRGWMLMQDPETGAVLDQWTSPLTNETVDVEHFATWVGRQKFSATGLERPENFSGDFTWFDREFVLPWQVLGDDVWCPYEQFSVYTDREGNSRYEKAIHTYQGLLSDLKNKDLTLAPATIASQSQSPWFPWMNMERVEGHMILRSLGKKYQTLNELPVWLTEELEKRYPGGLTDPLDWS